MALSRDARLVARARRGSDAAFERLYARHQPAILSFCRHLTGSREDAEDAVQHTFLAAYRRIVGADDDQLELRPWLFVVARNRCLSLLRPRRELAAPAVVDVEGAVFDGLSAEVERREDLRHLVRDMARLPEPQRAALVLSQLDALDYREIGAVLDVGPEKVKALVFQARSTLASAREAREAPCLDIRREIATARGPALRRRLLRRHVGQCVGCSEFEQTVLRQRRELGALLPVLPSAGLGQAVLDGSLGREAVAAGGGGGTGAAAAGGGAVGAASGGGLAGTLSLIGASGAAKVAVVAVAVGGGAVGAVAADLPARIDAAVPSIGSTQRSGGDPGAGPMAPGGTNDGGGGAPNAGKRTASDRATGGRRQGPGRRDTAAPGAAGGGREDGDVGPHADEEGSEAQGGGGGSGGGGGGPSGSPPGSEPGDDLPPGLAKRDELPPGLRRRDGLPPGLAKRDGAPPGRSGGSPGASNGGGSPGNSGGNGNANGPGNSGGGPATPGPSQGGGPPGGQGNPGGGQGNGNPSGQGGGNGSPGQGNGNGGNPH
jgi:RNA polymerase sigma factor (sigma-70 family)